MRGVSPYLSLRRASLGQPQTFKKGNASWPFMTLLQGMTNCHQAQAKPAHLAVGSTTLSVIHSHSDFFQRRLECTAKAVETSPGFLQFPATACQGQTSHLGWIHFCCRCVSHSVSVLQSINISVETEYFSKRQDGIYFVLTVACFSHKALMIMSSPCIAAMCIACLPSKSFGLVSAPNSSNLIAICLNMSQ